MLLSGRQGPGRSIQVNSPTTAGKTMLTQPPAGRRQSTRLLGNHRAFSVGHLPGQLRMWTACPSAPALPSASTSAPTSSSAACPEAVGSPLDNRIEWKRRGKKKKKNDSERGRAGQVNPCVSENTPEFNPRLRQVLGMRY